ncbi:MAG: hypothetical protein IPM51_01465 [Sphingobacteriaceae bacterium]|nr:hypothetical protein [Sphingobacteriaceae bacterium]
MGNKIIRPFFEDDEMLSKIFKEEYGFDYSEFEDKKETFTDTPIMVVSKVLDYFGDKSFFVFEYGNKHHNDLKALQDKKIINFGIDIYVVNPKHIFALMMDKTTDISKYDT